jgi:hypothetical protein
VTTRAIEPSLTCCRQSFGIVSRTDIVGLAEQGKDLLFAHLLLDLTKSFAECKSVTDDVASAWVWGFGPPLIPDGDVRGD